MCKHHRIVCRVAAIALMVVESAAVFADTKSSVSGVSAQAVRSAFRNRSAVNALMFSEKKVPEEPRWTLQFGVNYADNGNGSYATTTPSELRFKLPDGLTSLSLGGDLYDWVKEDGTVTKGIGDPTLSVLRKFDLKRETEGLLASFGVTIPTGSSVGDCCASQAGTLVYRHYFAKDALAKNNVLADGFVELWANVGHDNGGFPEGAKSVVWTGTAYYYQTFPSINDDTDVFVFFERGYRSGGGGISTVGIGGDFVVYPKQFGPFAKALGTLTGTCGVSAGRRCGSIEFDIQLQFK